jgi:hypothetical protein
MQQQGWQAILDSFKKYTEKKAAQKKEIFLIHILSNKTYLSPPQKSR